MTSWAVVVGINHYEHLSEQEQLRFAVSDAERVKEFLSNQAGFEEVFLCTDDSEPIEDLKTRPSHSNLRKILRRLGQNPQYKGVEHAWFFFSGHGLLSQNNQNYILTCDGDPDDLEVTALSVDFVIQQLIHCQAKNTVLVLDMCRNEAPSDSKGHNSFNEAQIVQQAQQNGIITIFSCSLGGKSYEIPDLQQGAFTYAFLEELKQHTTLKQLEADLAKQVFELTKGKHPPQVPLIRLEPTWRADLPLLPQCASSLAFQQLESRAYRAEVQEENLDLAERLWRLALDRATDPTDRDTCVTAFKRVAIKRQQTSSPTGTLSQTPTEKGTPPAMSRVEATPPAPQPPTPEPEDNLDSECNIDYRKLRDLLKAQKWKEADKETYEVMIRAVGKKSGDGFTSNELLNFPCTDLKTIDSLWVKYSKGHFGFSVQKQIYVECGAKLDGKYPGNEIWRKFGDRVGWRMNGEWREYKDINPSFFSPKGSFPKQVRCRGLWELAVTEIGFGSGFLFLRLAKCNR